MNLTLLHETCILADLVCCKSDIITFFSLGRVLYYWPTTIQLCYHFLIC